MSKLFRTCRTPDKSEAGFTLVEVLVALVLISVLAVVGVEGVRTATAAASAILVQVRYNNTLLLFDRIIRDAFSGFPPAFWGRPPTLIRDDAGYRIIDTADGSAYQVTVRAVTGLDDLLITYGGKTVLIPGVTKLTVTEARNGQGLVAGYRFALTVGSRTQSFVADFGGVRL